MPVHAPGTPTIPPPRPRLRDRPAGRRFESVHETMRRPSRPRVWVRPGAPSAGLRVRARRRAAARTMAAAVGAALALALLVAFALQREAQRRLVAWSQAPDAYAALADHVRGARIRSGRPVWRLRAGATHPDTRRQLDRLGVRVVDGDRRFDAFLFRPGGIGRETGYAHIGEREGNGSSDAGTFEQTAFASSATSWEPLGEGWYRVTGVW